MILGLKLLKIFFIAANGIKFKSDNTVSVAQRTLKDKIILFNIKSMYVWLAGYL